MSQPKLSILITGSNQGLGFEAARHLSKHSHVHLFICGRDEGRVQAATDKLKQDPDCMAQVDSVVMDIANDASINAAVADVERKLGGAGLDVLVVRLFYVPSPASSYKSFSRTTQLLRLRTTFNAMACAPSLKIRSQ